MARTVLLLAVVLLALPARGQDPGAAGDDATRNAGVAELLREADAAYAERDAPGALERAQAALEEAERRAPGEYEVLWRLAQLHFWRSDDPALGSAEKSRLGKRAWEYGERAVTADPDRVEGHHFAAAGMGNYALGIGVVKAIREGIEGKFKTRLRNAERIDPDFEDGAIQTAWGRFYFKLPWPKYDAARSERALLAAIGKNPENVRARVYLAELYRREGQRKAATEQLERAAAGEPGRYDAPEERRYQRVAREMLKN